MLALSCGGVVMLFIWEEGKEYPLRRDRGKMVGSREGERGPCFRERFYIWAGLIFCSLSIVGEPNYVVDMERKGGKRKKFDSGGGI